MNIKRIVSLLLAFAMVFGMVVPSSQAYAKENSKEFIEAEYKVENVDGESYKVYEFTDLVGTPKVNKQLEADGLEVSGPRIMQAVRSSNPELGDEIPDASNYMVDVQWTTYDLAPGQLGTPVHFQIYDKTSKKIIAQTVDITAKEDTKKYKFYKLPAWDDSDVSHETINWQMRAPNEYRFDIRLRTATMGHASQSTLRALISQRGMPIYRAEYYTNKNVPTIKVQRTNKDDITVEVPINPKNLTGDQYYSWAQAISSKRKPFFEGRLLDIQVYGQETLDNLQVSEPITAGRVKMAMKAPGKTEFDRGPGTFEDNGTPYHYEVTGDYLHLHIFTIRQDLKVKFDPNGGTWKKSAPADQTIGHSMKLGDTWAGLGPISVPGETALTPPAVEAGKPEKKFIGWNTDKNATTALFTDNTYATPITKDETFYAIYAEKEQGIAKAVYKDNSTNAPIDDKYKIAGKDYPTELKGNLDEKIADAVFDKKKAPKFIGYEITSIETEKVPKYPQTANYTKNGEHTVIYKYNKLADIIPAKDDNGNPNPKVTDDVKATYKSVTINVDGDRGQFKKSGTAKTETSFVYYVNPVEGKTLNEVLTASGLTAESKDTNVYKIDTTKAWTFEPAQTKANVGVTTSTEVTNTNFDKKNIDMKVNFVQTKADQLKDKLEPVDIRVWVNDTDTDGSKITWKNGVELNAANKDNETLKGLLAEATVTDLGENGKLTQEGTKRNSSKQNLPDGKKGTLKVAFDDGSALAVENQKLYVSPLKVPVKPNEPNQIDPDKLPNDKLAVEFKLGEGVKIGDKEGDKANPVLYTTYYVKPETDLKNDVPKVTLKEGFKDAKWYKGETTTVATDNDYKVTADSVFTAKATGKDKVVKLDDPENPTNFPKDPTDDSKKDAEYVTVKFVADVNGKIKEGDAEKAKGIAYAVLKNTEWADAVTGGVVVPKVDAQGNAPKLEGKDKFYSFKEWQKDGKVTEFAKVDADVTYTAVFGKADELTVNYKLNAPDGLTVGGTAPTDTDKYKKDEQVTVKALAADNTLAGYKFTGWNTQADGKGTAYAANAKFVIKANTELFAQWKKTADDVIPVNNENDKNGKNGEEIPDNYVFVDFKVKDDDADKADIKDGQQAKFKVDPKARVTLTAPELELKDTYKDSHTAKFNEAEYTNKVFTQPTTIFASVTEKGKVNVKYVFETNPNTKTLPDALMALKPEDLVGDKAVYKGNEPADPKAPDTSSEAARAALVEMKDGKKVGEWKAGDWAKTTDNDGNITYTLTWTFKEVEKPTPPTPPTPSGPSRPSGPSTPSKPEGDRVHGKDRVETAIEISKKYFGKANTVIVVDRKDFPDAMTASVLSKLLKAPILLTDTNKLDSRVAAEIQRLGAKDVIVVGGNKSVSEAVKKELAKFDKDTVERIYGRDRYETSAQVARRVVGITGKLGHGVVASGQVFADALTVAPYASREGYPILLVRANNLPKSVKDAIRELAINKVTIAGGYTTVNKSLEASLPTVAERLSGRTRYETAIDIATKKFNTNKIFLANGEYWMDALVIGPVGGILDMPILLTQANSAPQSLKDYIAKERIQKITAIGGTSMVSDRVLNELSK